MYRLRILNQIPPAEPTDYSESMDQAGFRIAALVRSVILSTV
jgi:hypothetical protein